jgi:nucleosome binding factor SPN SPT16 subunit
MTHENMRRDANVRHTASYLEPLKGGKVPVEILVRGKDADENKKQFQACLDTIKKAGKKVAVLKKDNSTGAFAEEWKASLQEAGFKEEDQVDLALILSNAALSVKDERELVSLLQALFFTTHS